MAEQPIRLFVYGTLRPDLAPAAISAHVARCRCVGSGCTRGTLYDLGRYPGVVLADDCTTHVVGELLELPDEATLHALDRYEGYDPRDPKGSLFVRVECDVTCDSTGETVRAWIYLYNRDLHAAARLVADGRYHPTTTMKRPTIGITLDYRDDGGGYSLTFDYVKSVEAAGGLPLLIPYKIPHALIPQYVDMLDGILFTGGNDLDPALYGETWHEKAVRIDPDRQNFELALMAEVERRRMPALGVCLGSQLMNVYRGGSLTQFIPEQREGSLEHRRGDTPAGQRHAVKIEPGTVLASVIDQPEIVANSRHKQAINRVGKGLRVNAHAPDGVVEGVEDPTFPLFMAVQWHPENLAANQPEHLAPFKLLIEKSIASAKMK